VAVEVTGGPQIPFHPGREVRFPNLCTPFLRVFLGLRMYLHKQSALGEILGVYSF
jgi:hypothetical protein